MTALANGERRPGAGPAGVPRPGVVVEVAAAVRGGGGAAAAAVDRPAGTPAYPSRVDQCDAIENGYSTRTELPPPEPPPPPPFAPTRERLVISADSSARQPRNRRRRCRIICGRRRTAAVEMIGRAGPGVHLRSIPSRADRVELLSCGGGDEPRVANELGGAPGKQRFHRAAASTMMAAAIPSVTQIMAHA